MQRQFADAFLKLTAGRDDQILTILRGQHFVRATDAEYRDIAEVARRLGMF